MSKQTIKIYIMRHVIFFLTIKLLLVHDISYSQSNATPKEVLLANLKINQIQPSQNAYINSNWTSFIKWYEYYGSMMNNTKYLSSINDEFKSEEYKKGLINEILVGCNNLDLTKKYFVTYNLKFGTYNSYCQCFPFENRDLPSYTLVSAKDFANWRRPLMGSYFDINLTNFFNFSDIDFSLKINPSEAEKFIATRKDKYGNVNRTIQAKVIFNFVNTPIQSKKNEYNLGCYIHKIEFFDNGRLISNAFPNNDYSDKVNLFGSPPLNMNGENFMRRGECKKFIIALNDPKLQFAPVGNDTVILRFEKVEDKSREWEIMVWKDGRGNVIEKRLTSPEPYDIAKVGECLVCIKNTDAIIVVKRIY